MCLAIPGKVLSIQFDGQQCTARVSFSGSVKSVNLSCVPEANVGDYVLVHAGFAISLVDEAEARTILEYFRHISAGSSKYSECDGA